MVAANVGPDGNAVALWATTASAEALNGRSFHPLGTSFADVLLDRPVQIRVTRQNPDGEVLAHTEIDDFRFAHPHIASMPSGQWLLAGSRCWWAPEGVDPNAAVYSQTGQALRYGILGDGLEQVRTTAGGDVWVGYFDEGIFGNFGWGVPGPEPVGSSGLVRFDQHLQQTWTYPRDADNMIYDEPTINVDGDEVWATFEPDYPVVHIVDGNVETWTNRTGAAHFVLVDSRRRVALVGKNVTIGDLGAGSFYPTSTTPIDDLAGTAGHSTKFFALGPTMHAIESDGAWWTIDLAGLASATA